MSDVPFGRSVLGATASELLNHEDQQARHERFGPLDRLLDTVVQRSLAGETVVAITKARAGATVDTITISGVEEHRGLLDTEYRLAQQETRGAWFLPETMTVKYGLCNLPAIARQSPRFAVNAARETVATVDLRTSDDSLAVWALLVPLFEALFAPIDLRTATTKLGSGEQQRETWNGVNAMYADLGIALDDRVAVFRYGGRWATMRFEDQLAAKESLLTKLATEVNAETIRRWRARSTAALTAAFYAKANKGTPLARTVLTKRWQRVLAGVFGGDWLAFLDYLGEHPNDGEKIATALPQPRLYVGGAERAADVAMAQGLPLDQVEKVLGALMGQSATRSPVGERIAVMREWWSKFDHVHSAQTTGTKSLWGLVDEGFEIIGTDQYSTPGLYRTLIPASLCAEVDRLWDGVTLARWPDRIVSEFHPHRQMAESFGPAAAFWHGCALTCWFVCEGPSSRTDLPGLAHYYRRELVALEESGFQIDPGLFTELIDAQARLGPPIDLFEPQELSVADGLTLSISYGRGQRRDGFEILRDIVTRHRRAWSVNLDAYLRDRWDRELRAVANEFNRRTATRGRPPTFKQVATFAIPAANHWFGGDLVRVYAALGETATGTTTRHDLLSGDPFVFANTVFADLGGQPPLPRNAPSEDTNKQWELRRLATESLRYLQLFEALGRPPTFEEFGANLRWDHLGGPEIGWAAFQAAIESARFEPTRAERPEDAARGVVAQPREESIEEPMTIEQLEQPAPARKGLLARLFNRA